MIQRFYSRLDLQLALLSGMLIISALLSIFLNFTPLLRFSPTNLFYGIVGGVVIIFFKALFLYQLNQRNFRKTVESLFSKDSFSATSLAKILIQSTGEETILRGFIFVPLVSSIAFFGSTVLALLVNALISIGIYSDKEEWGFFEGIQAVILGIIYLSTYSMLAVFTARFISEIALLAASHYGLLQLFLKRFSYVTKQPV